MKPVLVSVTAVTHNSSRFIGHCLDALLGQGYRPLEVMVVDNASQDESKSILARYSGRIYLIENDSNTGFAAAQNRAIAASRGQWILTLNPDVLVQPGFVERLVEAGNLDARVGAVCGKLLRIAGDFKIPNDPRIDSTGIDFTPGRSLPCPERRPRSTIFRTGNPQGVFGEKPVLDACHEHEVR